MNKKQKKTILRILIGSAVLAAAVLAPLTGYTRLALFLPAYLIIGGDVLLKAVRNIFHGQVFDENFLMSIATIGAFVIGDYPEGVAVMLFYQVGEIFQSYAVNRSRQSIASLMDIRPDYANISRDGTLIKVDPEEVSVGDIIVIKAGERIPLDGTIIDGSSTADTSALTGESVPKDLQIGDDVLSGCINLTGVLTVSVTKAFGESTVSKILELVENASSKKAKTENFITRFARYYTPAVVIAAVILAIVPPLLIPGAAYAEWVNRALIFLVISCPCALVISVPLSFFGGIGGASKCGILIKGSNYLEALSRTEVVVFDKTGTLTKGSFKVTKIQPSGISEAQLLELTAYAESYSTHPISHSLKSAYGQPIDNDRIKDVEEISGHGVKAVVDGKTVHAGNSKLMNQIGAAFTPSEEAGTVVYTAVNGTYAGFILIADEIKGTSAKAISALKASGIKKTVMLTGDSKTVGKKVAQQLNLDAVYAELLPGDKVDQLERLLEEKSPKGNLVFVGDGINDAPVLSRADIGIAMGSLGSDAAIEAADVVLMDDDPAKIATAIQISQKTLRIVVQNIVFALGIKAVFLIMGAAGLANMWEAVFADVGVSVIAILNATRALNVKNMK